MAIQFTKGVVWDQGTLYLNGKAVLTISFIDTDAALAANSDAKAPSQKAIKSYVDGKAIAATSLAKVTVRIQHTDLVDAVNG